MPDTRRPPAGCPATRPEPPQTADPGADDPPALFALSCRQPLASLLAAGWLTTSTRWFAPAHRGPVAVHASGALTDREEALWAVPAVRHACRRLFGVATLDRLPRGGLVGLCELALVLPVPDYLAAGKLTANDALVLPGIKDGFALRFSRPTLLPALIPCPGAAGLWELPPRTAEAVRRGTLSAAASRPA